MPLRERIGLALRAAAVAVLGIVVLAAVAYSFTLDPVSEPARADPALRTAKGMIERGRQAFRHDTLGSEAFFTDTLRLNEAVRTVTPRTALAVGLKVDSAALPQELIRAIKKGKVDLDDPATTAALLSLGAVVGIEGQVGNDGSIRNMGITCAFCHSTVDNSVAPGIGERLDGWANRDLNVGAILNLAPNLQPLADLLGVDVATVKTVLQSWGPGRFDAHLNLDGKAFRPDGKTASVLIPPAFGLAGVNLHTYNGWGSVTYWNAYVGNLEMNGKGTFYDPRLDDPVKHPVAAHNGFSDVDNKPDRITPKLADLHFYQLALAAPAPPEGSFDAGAARRGRTLFAGKAQCGTCHVPPLFTEPGWNLHEPEEIGIDSFQADRGPEGRYRTTPLRGLWTHTKGGFYHDGRFATLLDVVNHYDSFQHLGLTAQEKSDIVEYLKSL
jgi:hypothetical protein